MTTSDRAADVIRNHGTDTCQEPECIAQDLADADLLAPNLPEPDEHGKSGQFHMAEWLPLGTGLENPIVWTAAGAGRVMIQRIEPGELNRNQTNNPNITKHNHHTHQPQKHNNHHQNTTC